MKKITLLFTLFVFHSILFAQNFSATYSFDSVSTSSGLTDPTPLPTATGATFTAFAAVGTPVNPNSTGRFSFTGWATGATNNDNNFSNLTGNIDTSEYYFFTIGPALGYSLSLDSIQFRIQRSGTGIRTYLVRSSMDNYTSNISASINPTNTKLSVQTNNVFFWEYDSITSGQNGSTITLGGTNFNNLLSPVTFRFYAYNSEASSGTFSVDNVTINGTTSISNGIEENAVGDCIIYPNPNLNGIINISSSLNEATISIYDITGKIIYTKKQNSFPVLIDLSEKDNGIYFICIENGDNRITKKIGINK